MGAQQITTDEAERALRSRDWEVAEVFTMQLLNRDTASGLEWLSRLEAAVGPEAIAGNKYSQGVLGNVHLQRYLSGLHPDEETLAAALRWYMEAGRQDGGEPMLEMVRHWYVFGRTKGLALTEAARFLEEPDIAERYQRYAGKDIRWGHPASESK
jgi:hypothetical protein